MAKKSQLDKAIESLEQKRDGILAEAHSAAKGINAAIDELKGQRRAKPVRKPRAVVTAAESKAG